MKSQKMKICMVFVVAIFLFCNTVYAADDCESKYLNLINKVEESEKILDKEKYLSQLEKALQLCKEGKREQASKIVDDLRDDALFDEVFKNVDGH
jgi:hypothetical protein